MLAMLVPCGLLCNIYIYIYIPNSQTAYEHMKNTCNHLWIKVTFPQRWHQCMSHERQGIPLSTSWDFTKTHFLLILPV